MTIANFQFDLIGPRMYTPDGPFGTSGNTPLASFKPGTVVAGDLGSEFIYLLLPVVASMTMNQGDFLAWDNTMVATRTGEISVANEYAIGMQCGPIFFGGRSGDPAGNPAGGNIFSYTFPTAGIYGVWAQRAGTSLANISAITTLAIPTTIGGTLGRITFLAVPTKSNAISPGSVGFMPTSKTFTGDTTTGSAVVVNVNVAKFLQRGMVLTGSGIPGTTTSPATTIVDIQGNTVTMSVAATATAATVTVTALANSTSGTTTNTSALLTNVVSIVGFYPNQTIAGTGIPASTTILSIKGNPGGPYTITMSAAATATANNIAFTVTAMPNYNEVMLSWPFYSAITSA